MSHALFSPSSAHQWTVCPGSLILSRAYENETNSASEEGTMLHAVMQALTEKGKTLADFPDLDTEQRAIVNECKRYVDSIPRDIALYEVKVNFGDTVMQSPDESFGTADLVLVNGRTCRIVDYKFGHNYVSSLNNPQGILYAIGVQEMLEMLDVEVDTFEFEIIQPRVGGESVSNGIFTFPANKMADFIVDMRKACAKVKQADWRLNEVKDEPQKTKWDDEFLNVTEHGCKYCRASAGCSALRKKMEAEVIAFMDAETEAEGKWRSRVSTDELAQRMERIDMMKQYISAVEEEAMSRALSGDVPTGYMLAEGRAGQRKWADVKEVMTELENRGYVIGEFMTEPTLVSPAQVQNLLVSIDMGKADAKAFVDGFSIRSEPKPKLIRSDAGGKPWNPASATSVADFETLN